MKFVWFGFVYSIDLVSVCLFPNEFEGSGEKEYQICPVGVSPNSAASSLPWPPSDSAP